MKENSSQQLHMLRYTLTEQLIHGMEVSNLAYDLARELGYEKEICYELAKAGVLHDIGKIVLENYVEEQDTLVVEEMRFVRTHSTLAMNSCRDTATPILCWRVFCITMKIMTEPGIRPIWRGKRFRLGRVSYASVMCTAR